MESAIFHLNSNELDARFLENIKSFFKNQRIKVTITREEPQETNAELLALIEKSEKSTFKYQVPSDDFDELIEQFEADDNFNIAEAIAHYKTEKLPN